MSISKPRGYDDAVARLREHQMQRSASAPRERRRDLDTDRASSDQIIQEAEKYAYESEAAVQRMLQTSDATVQVGAGMLQELHRQGEILARAQYDVDRVQDIQKPAQKELRSIRSVPGQLFNAVAPEANNKVHDTGAKVKKKQRKIDAKAAKKVAKAECRRSISSAAELPSEVKVLSPAAQAAFVNTDAGLDTLSERLSSLKVMAREMGHELDRQEPQLIALARSEAAASSAIHANTQRVSNSI